MGTIDSTNRPTRALVVFLCAALIASIGFAATADSKRFSKKVIRSVSAKRLAGVYSGVTEDGGAVSFRLARSGKIVDLVVPVLVQCETDIADFDMDGTWTYFGGEIVKSSKTVSLRSAPISGRKKEAHYPFGTTFEIETRLASDQPPPGTQAQEYQVKVKFKEELFSGPGANVYWPIPKRAAAVHGEVAMGTRNGPLDEHAPGRERCATTSSLSGLEGHPRLEDFDARKTGG